MSVAATLRLLQAADSLFPSGGFASSQGLESLAADGRVADAAQVEAYLRDHLLPRWMTCERWFLIEAFTAAPDIPALARIDRLCAAQITAAATLETSGQQGQAMLTTHARMGTAGAAAYLDAIRAGDAPGHAPVAQGVIAAGLRLDAAAAQAAAAHQLLTGAVSAAVRLNLVGALTAQVMQARLIEAAADAIASPLPDAPLAFEPLAEIAAMRHPRLATRLFAA